MGTIVDNLAGPVTEKALSLVDQVARAVLYEGYLLYPYRLSAVKNRQRWTFGGVYPRGFGPEERGTDPWQLRTECLAEVDQPASLALKVRFLHLIERKVGKLTTPQAAWIDGEAPPFTLVDHLTVNEQIHQPWQEAREQEVTLRVRLGDVPRLMERPFSFAANREYSPLTERDGTITGVLVRDRLGIKGKVQLATEPAAGNLWRVTVRVQNLTPVPEAASREQVLPLTLASTHTILHLPPGGFVSLLEPPPKWADLAAACRNEGVWPVLVGAEGETHTVLSSPIILYDYPQIAPESPGDFFDATEIDEMLTLRILTMTDAEKSEMRAADEHARALLQRTESLGIEAMSKLHGAVRKVRPASPEDLS
jgi:hypothetical protein